MSGQGPQADWWIGEARAHSDSAIAAESPFDYAKSMRYFCKLKNLPHARKMTGTASRTSIIICSVSGKPGGCRITGSSRGVHACLRAA
jgi:hypothetical protein